MKLARALGLGLALGLGAAAAGGCSALVTGEVEQVGCQQEGAIGPPACPVGQACRGGQCTACAPKEVCGNGADDDCNGKPDDGCEDAGTGGTGAGGTFGGGGSGGIGGDPQGGTGGAPTGGGGSSGSGATGATGGTDAGTGGTGGTGPTGGTGGTGGGIGSSCIDSTACPADMFCADPTWFGGSGPKVCARGCCTSEGCGTGSAVCFPSVWGGNVCLPASSAGRGAVGIKTVGTPCGADSECRSGLCDTTCVDTCCVDGDCAGSDYCTRKIIKGTTRSALLCGKPPGTKAFQNPCGGGSECLSAICESSVGICTKPCCAKKDCSGFADWECVYNGGVRVCGTLGPSGATELGQPCSWGYQCKSAQCINLGQGGVCTDSCCTDKDCGAGFGCKPVKRTDNSIVLLCVGL